MLVPVKWLKDYVDYDMKTEELALAMTMSGTNVESIKTLGENIQGVVVGKIESIKPHPNADKLRVCFVDVGGENALQIITGAENVKEGDKVPTALEGSQLPIGIKIKTTKFRGLESQGMMCSAQELKLETKNLPDEQKNGILILPENAPIGEDVKKILGLDDEIIEFEITTNRPDCLSIVGIAREAAVTVGGRFKFPEIVVPEGQGNISNETRVDVEDPDLCPRYTARLIKNVRIKPSPIWMQQRLRAAGIRPINNIVDITNYVMLELGQPLHAFDFECLNDKRIIVRRAKKGEKLVTLDGIERELDESVLVIADSNKPVGIAGVMGGENSEITEKTQTVLLESANFNSTSIRRTAKKLGLRTEASSRFEKGIDPNIAEIASNRFVQLVEQLDAGDVVNGIIDIYPKPLKPWRIKMRPGRINKILGTNLTSEQMEKILNSLGLKVVEKSSEHLFVEVPTFRKDITREEDLSEEIGRIYGFDNIPPTLPKGSTTFGTQPSHMVKADKTKDILNACGISEIITFSFISPQSFDKINLPKESPLRKVIKLMNPLGEDTSVMRTTLIPNMLSVISYNLSNRQENIALFELGRVYRPKSLPLKELPDEYNLLTIGMSDDKIDFYDLKGVVETLFENLGVTPVEFNPYKHPTFHPGRTAEVLINGKRAGVLGEIHPDVNDAYDIKKRVYLCELEFDLIAEQSELSYKFEPIPRYPAVERDLAIVVNDSVLAKDIENTIIEAGGSLIKEIDLFDIYKGKQIPEGKKSMAYSLMFRANDRTLTDEEVNNIYNKIVDSLKNKFNAKLRD
ncbi:MAG: phenylalanyl-tRNA synthetase beta chain [Thermosediminibacterales bacterium]|nr:phenylalanyl-tRNA synthetase beta chain [Thermosediminibacterales bacterium]MDK2835470.1 phenylalanyl-tRNA synthetase beta chain [Thermosediminibacterales bacterium]